MPEGHLLNTSLSPPVTLSTSPVRQAFDDFMLSREAMRCTPATLEHYRYTAGVFVAWLERQGILAPEAVNAAHVRAWLAGAPQLAASSLHARARGVRTLLRFWHQEKYLSAPVTFAMPRIEKRRLPYLAAEQFRKALKAAPTPRDRALLLFLADSGIRRAECLALNWADVDPRSGVVIITRGKGGKARTVAIGARTRRALITYRRTQPAGDAEPVFQTDEGGRLTAMGMRSIFSRLSKRAGFKIGAHALRRTFAVMFLRSEGDVVALQALLGHADVSTTTIYLGLTDSDVLAEHQAHGLDAWI